MSSALIAPMTGTKLIASFSAVIASAERPPCRVVPAGLELLRSPHQVKNEVRPNIPTSVNACVLAHCYGT